MSLAELAQTIILEKELSYEEVLTSDFYYILTHPLEFLKAYSVWWMDSYKI